MAIPKVSEQSILEAIKYIDENGVPDKDESIRYELVTEGGVKYPPKYVLAVADHIENGTDITTDAFSDAEAKAFFEKRKYMVETKQEKYELIITAENVTSTDKRFTMDNLVLGDGYKTLDSYFKSADGEVIRRKLNKGERQITNQTMPRIACQIFEKQLMDLSPSEKKAFPVCRYTPDRELICGIYSSVEEYNKDRTGIHYLIYTSDSGERMVIYGWNLFSTIIFCQECLKRFGKSGDQFVLSYRMKDENESKQGGNEKAIKEELVQQVNGYRNPYSSKLVQSKNIILRGAPGTGKSYLAKEIAADIISDGYYERYIDLTEEQKKQVEFVQFHPSYDYSDFVEGLRPRLNEDGSMGFELQDGVFKKFVAKARKNYEDSQKSKEMVEKELSVREAMTDFLSNIELGVDSFKTITGNEFFITNIDDSYITVSIPGNATVKKLVLNISEIQQMLEADEEFEKISDITSFFGLKYAKQSYSYEFAIYKEIAKKRTEIGKISVRPVELKKYIFIIDEINRGEISKILGELFFAIDPGYRGRAGEVTTQYSNMHADGEEKFYIPDNVYIIGTMNDIDRSVDSFDFAMRRRFRFFEIKADERLEMLDLLEEDVKKEAIKRMSSLNKVIKDVEDLNENYQIGASYFLKLKSLSFNELWTDCLEPLLRDYVQGMYDEDGIMKKFAKAYGYKTPNEGDADETNED